MECCPRGTCITTNRNGTSRCKQAGPTPLANEDYLTDDPSMQFSQECQQKGDRFRTCLTCADACSEEQTILTSPGEEFPPDVDQLAEVRLTTSVL